MWVDVQWQLFFLGFSLECLRGRENFDDGRDNKNLVWSLRDAFLNERSSAFKSADMGSVDERL